MYMIALDIQSEQREPDLVSNILYNYLYSKSVHDYIEKSDLLFCNMDTHLTRKVKCEKVQLSATLGDCNL